MQGVISKIEKEKTMSELLRKLKDDLFSAKITREELASYIGVAKSTLSDILNEKIEISFIYLVRMIMKIYDKPSLDLTDNRISEYLIYAKPENKREALEYAAFRRDFTSLKKLIDNELLSDTEENRQWAEVYELIYRHCSNEEEYDSFEFYDELESKRKQVLTYEMKVLIDILICQTMYQMEDYRPLFKRIEKVEKRASNISNKYIRSSYLARIKEGMSVAYLMQDKIHEARSNCNSLLELCEKNPSFLIQKVNALYNIGESYIFENYTQSKYFLESSLIALKNSTFKNNEEMNVKRNKIERTLTFLKIHYYKDLHTLPKLLDKEDQAYLEYKKGNLLKAESLLIELKSENGVLNEFQMCYLGLIKKDRFLLEKSYMIFKEKNSNFYSKLPSLYLGHI